MTGNATKYEENGFELVILKKEKMCYFFNVNICQIEIILWILSDLKQDRFGLVLGHSQKNTVQCIFIQCM